MDFFSDSEEDTRAVLAQDEEARTAAPPPMVNLAITVPPSDEAIGSCGLFIHNPRRGIAELYYALRRGQWGKGYATEAADALLRLAFEKISLHRVFGQAAVENEASWRVLEKAGFRREGLLRDALPAAGLWHDAYLYAMLDSELAGTTFGLAL